MTTQDQVVAHFIAMTDLSGNWGTSLNNSKWDVDGTTYINGIMLTVDGDYYMGYLLEVVERADPSAVSYVAIATFYGPKDGIQQHDAQWYPHPCGSFFDRTITQDEIALWGVRSVYGLWESYDDARAASKRNHPTGRSSES